MHTNPSFYAKRKRRIRQNSLFDSDTEQVRHARLGGASALAYREVLRYWSIKLIAGQCANTPISSAGNPQLAAIAYGVQLPQLADPQASAETVTQAIAKAVQEIGECPEPADCHLKRNLAWLAHSAALNPTEAKLMEFMVCIDQFDTLHQVAELQGALNYGALVDMLSALLGLEADAVSHALRYGSALQQMGMVHAVWGSCMLSESLSVPTYLGWRLVYHADDPAELLNHLLTPLGNSSPLHLQDYPHLQKDTRIAQLWLQGLRRACALGQVAGHMLVHGAPGLGKTEWVRALLRETQGVQGLETQILDSQGGDLSGYERLQQLRMALRLIAQGNRDALPVLVLDEADDIFVPQGEEGAGVGIRNHRASLNHLLELSPVPMVWIMNDADILDPAVRRRFDVEVCMPVLPEAQRWLLLQQQGLKPSPHQGDSTAHQVGVEPSALHSWSQAPSLTPALIQRLGLLQRRLELPACDAEQGDDRNETSTSDTGLDLELAAHWLRCRLPSSQARHITVQSDNPLLQAVWMPQASNPDIPLPELVAQVRKLGGARVLLHGAPGTGKTALAAELAVQLGKPLLVVRPSDVLSPFVGMTEQGLSGVFAKALVQDAVLVLDEADSLLQHRASAQHQWEVTQVNELLIQLQDFSGVVVLTTNRLPSLDSAVMRRMDLRIACRALDMQQRRDCLQALADLCGVTEPWTDAQQECLQALYDLNAGDLAVARRRLAMQGWGRGVRPDKTESPEKTKGAGSPDLSFWDCLLQILQAERDARHPQPFGFVSQAGQSPDIRQDISTPVTSNNTPNTSKD